MFPFVFVYLRVLLLAVPFFRRPDFSRLPFYLAVSPKVCGGGRFCPAELARYNFEEKANREAMAGSWCWAAAFCENCP